MFVEIDLSIDILNIDYCLLACRITELRIGKSKLKQKASISYYSIYFSKYCFASSTRKFSRSNQESLSINGYSTTKEIAHTRSRISDKLQFPPSGPDSLIDGGRARSEIITKSSHNCIIGRYRYKPSKNIPSCTSDFE